MRSCDDTQDLSYSNQLVLFFGTGSCISKSVFGSMRVSITLSFATCILCFLKRESESDDFTNGSLLADISQYMSSQRSIERDNRTLSKRVNSMASPYGSFPSKVATKSALRSSSIAY